MTTVLDTDVGEYRKPAHDIEPLIVNRWSPRSMTAEPVSDKALMCLFEAARWAPSCFNGQPWRFLYAKRESAHWQTFFQLMVEFNQSWARNAAALVVVVSKTTFDHNGKPAQTHSFDSGAAWQNLAIQATAQGLVAHGMQGFDYESARTELNVPDDHAVEMMIALGKPGKRDDLPEKMRDREVPSARRPLDEIVIEGGF